MAQNNLRILYKNQVTQVNSSATANSVNDFKSQWDSGTTFTVTTNSLTGPIAVVAVLAESANTAVTMTVTGQTAVTESTTSAFSGTAGYGGLKYIVKYYTLGSATTSFTVSFGSTVKVSKFLIGNYWTPKYNLTYGSQLSLQDLSTQERTQSGDQYLVMGPRHKTLTFSMEYIDDVDKFTLYDVIRGIGKTTPVFVSLFPQDSDQQKEQMYSIYGRFSDAPTITNFNYNLYNTSYSIEEF